MRAIVLSVSLFAAMCIASSATAQCAGVACSLRPAARVVVLPARVAVGVAVLPVRVVGRVAHNVRARRTARIQRRLTRRAMRRCGC